MDIRKIDQVILQNFNILNNKKHCMMIDENKQSLNLMKFFNILVDTYCQENTLNNK